MYVLGILALLTLAAVVAVVALRHLFPLPDISRRAPSRAMPVNKTGPLGCFLAEEMAANPGKTGVVTLTEAAGALAERLAELPDDQHEPVEGFSPQKIRGLYLTNAYETGDKQK